MQKIQKYNFKQGMPHEFDIIDFSQLFNQSLVKITQIHRAEFYHILWFQEGSTTHLVDFKPIQILSNTILFVNKNSFQHFTHQENIQGKVIIFTDEFFCQTESDTSFLKSSILFNDLFAISKIDVSKLTSIFSDIFRHMEVELENTKDVFQSDIIRNHLRNLLLHSERERRKQDFIEFKKDVNLDHTLLMKDLVEDHFIDHKKVSYYCQKMHITPKRLNNATSKILGKTPKEIIDDRVLLESKRLLAQTSDTIKEIAFSMGFEEPTNFNKYFKKHNHKTPVEFRNEFI